MLKVDYFQLLLKNALQMSVVEQLQDDAEHSFQLKPKKNYDDLKFFQKICVVYFQKQRKKDAIIL